jgi:aminocarboxymuconate-semialdehyde decarboxylase
MFAAGPLVSPGAAALRESMSEAGVDVAVISVPPPGVHAATRDKANPDVATRVNDELLALAEAADGQLRVWLALPMPDPDAAVREIKRRLGHPLVVGAGLYSHSRPWCLDSGEFDPLFRVLADNGLVAQLHPGFEDPEPRYQAHGLAGSLDAVYVNGLVAARLIYGGTFDRVPDARVVVTHLGGTLPFLAQRLHDMSGRTASCKQDIFHYCRHNLWYDNCSYHTPALVCTATSFGASRIVLGSDFPFRGPLRRCVNDLAEGGFSTADEAAICRAQNLLRHAKDKE